MASISRIFIQPGYLLVPLKKVGILLDFFTSLSSLESWFQLSMAGSAKAALLGFTHVSVNPEMRNGVAAWLLQVNRIYLHEKLFAAGNITCMLHNRLWRKGKGFTKASGHIGLPDSYLRTAVSMAACRKGPQAACGGQVKPWGLNRPFDGMAGP